MKSINKFFFPFITLFLLAVSVVGVAFAREASALDDSGPSGEIEFVGAVETISDSSWTIDAQVVAVNAQTEINDAIMVGDMVKVHAAEQIDGSLTAREIELADTDDLASDDNSNDNSDDDMDDDNGNDNDSVDNSNDNSNDNGYDDNGNDNGVDDNGNGNGNGNGNDNDNDNDDDDGNNNSDD